MQAEVVPAFKARFSCHVCVRVNEYLRHETPIPVPQI